MNIKALSISALLAAQATWADDALTEKLSLQAGQIKSLSGQFSQQKTIQILPLPLESSGRYDYNRESGMLWHTHTPVQSTLQITSAGIFTGDDRQKLEGSGQLGEILLGVFSGQLEPIQQQFHIDADGNFEHWTLMLTPKSSLLAGHITSIQIEGGENVERVQMVEANGDQTLIAFTVETITPAQ